MGKAYVVAVTDLVTSRTPQRRPLFSSLSEKASPPSSSVPRRRRGSRDGGGGRNGVVVDSSSTEYTDSEEEEDTDEQDENENAETSEGRLFAVTGIGSGVGKAEAGDRRDGRGGDKESTGSEPDDGSAMDWCRYSFWLSAAVERSPCG